MNYNTAMHARLSAAGFTITSTGGNCTALARRYAHDGHTWDILITDELSAPLDVDNPSDTYGIVVSCELDETGADNNHYQCNLRGETAILHAVADVLLSTMTADLDYTLSEVWPDWTNHIPA